MDDEVFTPNPIKVDGFTAQYLATNYPLSALGAYNFAKKDITTESGDVSILNWVFGFYFLDKFSILTLQQTATKRAC